MNRKINHNSRINIVIVFACGVVVVVDARVVFGLRGERDVLNGI